MSCQLSRRSKSFVAKEKFSPEIWPKYPAMIIILKKLRTRTCVFQVLCKCYTLVEHLLNFPSVLIALLGLLWIFFSRWFYFRESLWYISFLIVDAILPVLLTFASVLNSDTKQKHTARENNFAFSFSSQTADDFFCRITSQKISFRTNKDKQTNKQTSQF